MVKGRSEQSGEGIVPARKQGTAFDDRKVYGWIDINNGDEGGHGNIERGQGAKERWEREPLCRHNEEKQEITNEDLTQTKRNSELHFAVRSAILYLQQRASSFYLPGL